MPLPVARVAALSAAAFMACASADCAAAVLPGSAAPDFTLRSSDGHNVRLRELRGQVVLVNFWATWCGPCREEMPQLGKLYDKYRASGFTLLGVNIDEDSRSAQDLAHKLGVKFPVLFDADKAISHLYELGTMPSTVLIDKDGRIRFVHHGYRDGFAQTYDTQIRGLLKE